MARRYGAALGFAFQVQDDVLDVEGDVDKGGKTRGRDQKHDKLTTVRALGIDGAKALAQRISDDAIAFATELAQGKAPDATLLALARFAAQRTY